MSADLLRQAAALMRERATAATPGPWRDVPMGSEGSVVLNHSNKIGTSRRPARCDEFSDAEHIASWHPAVALAVADWLDVTATSPAFSDPLTVALYSRGEGMVPTASAALAVARAYLGDPS